MKKLALTLQVVIHFIFEQLWRAAVAINSPGLVTWGGNHYVKWKRNPPTDIFTVRVDYIYIYIFGSILDRMLVCTRISTASRLCVSTLCAPRRTARESAGGSSIFFRRLQHLRDITFFSTTTAAHTLLTPKIHGDSSPPPPALTLPPPFLSGTICFCFSSHEAFKCKRLQIKISISGSYSCNTATHFWSRLHMHLQTFILHIPV